MVRVGTVGIRGDVAIEQPNLSTLDQAISIFEVYTPISRGLDLSPGQDDSGFEPLKNVVVMKGLSVNRDLFAHRTTPGVAPRFPGPVCCGGGVAMIGNATAGGVCAPAAGVTSGLFPPSGGGICPGTTVPELELEDVAAGTGGACPKGEFAGFAG